MENAGNASSLALLEQSNGAFWNQTVVVRVLHRWESRNFKKGMMLMGHELLLIDGERTGVQAFIPARLLTQFAQIATAGKVYGIRRFMLRPAKDRFRIAEHKYTVIFTDQTIVDEMPGGGNVIPDQLFRFRLFKEFAAITDSDTDLFDVIGEVMHVNGIEKRTGGGSEKGNVSLHLRLKDGEVMRIYLWSGVAEQVRHRWETAEQPPTVVLLTTMNCRTLGGVVSLKTTSATRVFMDSDITETKEFKAWLAEGAPGMPKNTSSSSAVTKVEPATIDELHQFIQSANLETFTKTAFSVAAEIIEVPRKQNWYYISCSSCPAKLIKAATSLYCSKCAKTNNVGVTRFRFEVSVRDVSGDKATFIIFDTEATKLLGKSAPDVLEQSEQAAGFEDPHTTAPACLETLVGGTWNFEIQIAKYNLTALRQTFTVNRITELENNKVDDIESEPGNSKDEVSESKRSSKRARMSG